MLIFSVLKMQQDNAGLLPEDVLLDSWTAGHNIS